MRTPVITVAVANLILASTAVAQTRPDLVGTWSMVSNNIEQNGKVSPNYGETPKGLLILTSDGHFENLSIRSDLPKFASGKRLSGTVQENEAVVHGSIALFGTYVVDGSTLVLHVDQSTFPNWSGQEQRRPFTLSGDKLEYSVPASGANGTSHIGFVRVSAPETHPSTK